VERYGTRLFTLFNAGPQPREATLTIALRALGLPVTLPHVTNLVTGEAVPARLNGDTVSLTLPLAPEQTAALELR
jgi:hypothetical protein